MNFFRDFLIEIIPSSQLYFSTTTKEKREKLVVKKCISAVCQEEEENLPLLVRLIIYLNNKTNLFNYRFGVKKPYNMNIIILCARANETCEMGGRELEGRRKNAISSWKIIFIKRMINL